MTTMDLVGFLRSTVPTHAEVDAGKDDMIRVADHVSDAQVYIKYTEGLDFSLQGVRGGDKSPTKSYSFKNENEMIAILGSKVLELLDGERRL